MRQFYLFRHAQSQANVGGIPLPDREIPLTESRPTTGFKPLPTVAHSTFCTILFPIFTYPTNSTTFCTKISVTAATALLLKTN